MNTVEIRSIAGCPVAADEITAGLVLHLDTRVLVASQEVLRSRFGVGMAEKPRSFLCIGTRPQSAWWVALSTTPRSANYQRLQIPQRFLSGGVDQWQRDSAYVLDGATLMFAMHTAIVQASAIERTTPDNRARVDAQGLEMVIEEVTDQWHRQTVRIPPLPRGAA